MEIIRDLPPIWDEIVNAGMNPDPSHIIFTYGDKIYNPSGRELEEHLIHHEETHMHQQGTNPDAWWGRYMMDKYFRIDQETEAYARQYTFICKTLKDKNYRHKVLRDLATFLSGPAYGHVIGYRDAYNMINQRSGVP